MKKQRRSKEKDWRKRRLFVAWKFVAEIEFLAGKFSSFHVFGFGPLSFLSLLSFFNAVHSYPSKHSTQLWRILFFFTI